MRWLRTDSIGLWSHQNGSQRVETQGDHRYAGGTEPEKFRIRRTSFKCVEISHVEELGLCTTSRVDTVTDHEPPLQRIYEVSINKAVTEITGVACTEVRIDEGN